MTRRVDDNSLAHPYGPRPGGREPRSTAGAVTKPPPRPSGPPDAADARAKPHDPGDPQAPGVHRPRQTNTYAPQPLEPALKARAPGSPQTVQPYRQEFRRRLSDRLRTLEISPSELRGGVQNNVLADLRTLRVSILEVDGEHVAVTNTERVGASGKVSWAMAEDGVLLAAKSLRTLAKSPAGSLSMGAKPASSRRATTAVSDPADIAREVDLLRRYVDPRVALVPYGIEGKKLIIMPAGLCDLAQPTRSIGAKRDALARVALSEVARQLTTLHEDGLLHHDIKPANIITMPDGRVRLIDLGEARRPSEVEQPATPAYSAPEWYDVAAKGSLKADIWSLGLSVAQVRLPIPRGLLAPSDDFVSAILAANSIDAGLEKARISPSPAGEATPADDDHVGRWAAYFRDLRAQDPHLGALVIDRMLVPEMKRATAAEVAEAAQALAAPHTAAIGALCRQEDRGAHRTALKAALALRLEDERAAAADSQPSSGAADKPAPSQPG